MGNLDDEPSGTTRAVVIGISNYMNDSITDLQFAHRDAEIFYDYLRSNAGGALPKENIRLMTNEKATLAAIGYAIDWLERVSQKGDKAIFYFSGHGDVEKQTMWQRGYLLAHDSPPNNFRNNAVRIEDLDDIVKTLSVGREAKVVIILDACRSGKLANAGSSLTNEQLAKQYENEVRILACKADQKSLEGDMWGQGRGLFSYYLVNGMKGLADGQNDRVVTFEEMKSYLEANVRKAIAEAGINARQNPVFIGDESYELAAVDEQTLLALNQEIASTASELVAVADRVATKSGSGETPEVAMDEGSSGIALAVMAQSAVSAIPDVPVLIDDITLDYYLKSAEIKSLVLSPEFEKALQSRDDLLNFFTSGLASQKLGKDDQGHFANLMRYAEKDPQKREELAMQLVVELNNRVQVALNAYLQADANELAERQFVDLAAQYIHYPRMLQAAMLLAGEDYTQLSEMQVKFYYLDGVCSRLQRQMGLPDPGGLSPMQKQKKALATDDEAAAARHDPQSLYTADHVEGGTIRCQPPYVHNEIGLLYLQEGKLDSALYHFKTAAVLAPKWAIPRSNLSIINIQKGQLKEAKENATRAIELKPDFPKSYLNLGKAEMADHDCLKSEAAFRKAITLDSSHYVSFEQMGNLLLKTTEYKAANWFFGEAERLKKGAVPVLLDSGADGVPDFEDVFPITETAATFSFEKFEDPPSTEADFLNRGIFYLQNRRFDRAESDFRKVIEFNAENEWAYHYLGLTLYQMARHEEAELAFLKLQKLRPNSLDVRYQLADVYAAQKRCSEEEEIYRGIIQEHPAPSPDAQMAFKRYISFLNRQSRYPELEKMLVEYAAMYDNMYQSPIKEFYIKMAEKYPENVEWLYRCAAFLSKDVSNYKAVEAFEKIIVLDTTHPAIGHIHEMVGKHYLSVSTNTEQTEWETILAKGTKPRYKNHSTNEDLAIHHFLEAIRLDSLTSSAKFGLVAALSRLRRYDDALPVLAGLLEAGHIDLPHRIQLADLYALSGKFKKADSLLQVAEKIRFEPTPGLNEVRGKSAMFQGHYADAIRFYEAELTLNSEDSKAEVCYTLARLSALKGDQSASLQWLEKALGAGFKFEWVIRNGSEWNELRKKEQFTKLLGDYGLRP